MERLQLAAQRKMELEHRRASRKAMADYVAGREAEAIDETEEVRRHINRLDGILKSALKREPRIVFEKLKVKASLPRFDPHGYDVHSPEPQLDQFLPPPMPLFWRLLPFLVSRHEEKVEAARNAFNEALAFHADEERKKGAALEKIKSDYRAACQMAERVAADKNAEIDAFASAYEAHERDAVIDYFGLVIDSDNVSDALPADCRITYVPESHQLVVERELPTIDVVPAQSGYRYVKKGDRLDEIKRRPAEIRTSYADLIAQISLRTLWILLRADAADAVAVFSLNGFVDTIDPATGNRVRPMLISVSATKDALAAIAFDRIEPIACLKNLKALVSRNAHELEPVRPLVNFDMADRRFIDKKDVLSDLDTRPNLAELSPSEFESLMTNLFEKMGLETRLTQASRDGGVDCVAWDMRPVIGGKVVIQAKRYKNTVGVSAVRDLYGTMMNEGAAKGILVTTSGYGQSAYDFAKNKPIELITGSNLLSMLAEYAKVEAKITFPQDWTDHQPV